MKIKLRPLGWLNLLHLFITIVVTAICFLLPIYDFWTKQYDAFHLVAVIFTYPLIIHFIQTYNRYILIDNEEIIFQIEKRGGSLMSLPEFYQDKFNLKDLKFYGVFSAPYIKGYTKADRKKGADNPGYDILKVKEGNLKVPLGAITIGNPLAFVFQKDQYILDDYLFTSEQCAALFKVINDISGISPGGGIKANNSDDNKVGLAASLFTVLGIVIALVIPWLTFYLLSRYTDLPIVFATTDLLTTATMTFFTISNLALVVRFHSGARKTQNYNSYELMEFLAGITWALLFLVTAVCFIWGYIF